MKLGVLLLNLWRGLHTTLGQALSGITALASLAWFLWPEEHWRVHPDALASLIVTLLAWIVSLSPTKASSTKHDRELFQKFRDVVGEKERTFLREHDLGNSFSWKSLNGLTELADRWKGAEFEFDDPEMQKKLAEIVRRSAGFVYALSMDSQPLSGGWASIISDHERGSFFSKETDKRVRGYNEQATELGETIDEFIRYARPKLER